MTCELLEKLRLKLQLAGDAAVDLHCAHSLITLHNVFEMC